MSSARAGTLSTAFSYNMATMASLSNALAALVDVASPEERESLPPDLRDCVVFGFVINENTAHSTIAWRIVGGTVASEDQASGAAEETPKKVAFHYAKRRLYALYDSQQVFELLQDIDYIKHWIAGSRRKAIVGLLQTLGDRTVAARREELRGEQVAR